MKDLISPKCRKCGIALNSENWYPSFRECHSYICKDCRHAQLKAWRKTHPEKSRAITIRYARNRGVQSFKENKNCASYLGVHVAERVLKNVFKNVRMMPMGNPGFDFICNKGMKIDVKSACTSNGRWLFHIRQNKIADYFLCLAFGNRDVLNPLYMWLIPGNVVNHLKGTSVGISTIDKWYGYRLSINDVVTCCEAMR